MKNKTAVAKMLKADLVEYAMQLQDEVVKARGESMRDRSEVEEELRDKVSELETDLESAEKEATELRATLDERDDQLGKIQAAAENVISYGCDKVRVVEIDADAGLVMVETVTMSPGELHLTMPGEEWNLFGGTAEDINLLESLIG